MYPAASRDIRSRKILRPGGGGGGGGGGGRRNDESLLPGQTEYERAALCKHSVRVWRKSHLSLRICVSSSRRSWEVKTFRKNGRWWPLFKIYKSSSSYAQRDSFTSNLAVENSRGLLDPKDGICGSRGGGRAYSSHTPQVNGEGSGLLSIIDCRQLT